MVFCKKKNYLTAIELAKENNHQEIVELLAKGPTPLTGDQTEETSRQKSKISELERQNDNQYQKISSLEQKIGEFERQNENNRMIGDFLEEAENFFIDNSTERQFIKTCGRIGEGATSVTYKCYDCRTRRPLCKKVLKYNNGTMTIKDAQNALKEFEVLHRINHKCICKSVYANMSDELEVVVIFIFLTEIFTFVTENSKIH